MYLAVVIGIEYKKIDTRKDYPKEKEFAIVCYLDESNKLIKKRISLIGMSDAQYYFIGDLVSIDGETIDHLDIRVRANSISQIKKLKEAIGLNHITLDGEQSSPERTHLACERLKDTLREVGSESHINKK